MASLIKLWRNLVKRFNQQSTNPNHSRDKI
jgi:hypothetical protein